MVPEPEPQRPSFRQSAIVLLTILAVVATSAILGLVRLADVLDQALAEFLVLACVAAATACRQEPPR